MVPEDQLEVEDKATLAAAFKKGGETYNFLQNRKKKKINR